MLITIFNPYEMGKKGEGKGKTSGQTFADMWVDKRIVPIRFIENS